MPNRAERRAQSKRGAQGTQPYSNRVRGRGRSTPSDEYALQERSRRLAEHESLQWHPSSSADEVAARDPDRVERRRTVGTHTIRRAFQVLSWVLIGLAMVMFLVVMWLPSHPLWLIITVSVVFIVGVLSLFLSAQDPKLNPNLDANGTAI